MPSSDSCAADMPVAVAVTGTPQSVQPALAGSAGSAAAKPRAVKICVVVFAEVTWLAPVTQSVAWRANALPAERPKAMIAKVDTETARNALSTEICMS